MGAWCMVQGVYTLRPQLPYLLQQGCGHTTLPQASWITHVGLIPFILSVLSVTLTRTGPSPKSHTYTRAQDWVPVCVIRTSGSPRLIIPGPDTSWEIPFPPMIPSLPLSPQPASKALNPCVTTRPPAALCQGSSLMYLGG